MLNHLEFFLFGSKTQKNLELDQVTSFTDYSMVGKTSWWRYYVGLFLVIVSFYTLGVFLCFDFMKLAIGQDAIPYDPSTGNIVGVPPVIELTAYCLPFFPMIITQALWIKYLHGRPFKTLITIHKSIDCKRIAVGFCLNMALYLPLMLLDIFVLNKDVYYWSFDSSRFFLQLPVIFLLIPIQSTVEEIVFRGYLLQAISIISKNKLALSIMSGLVFMYMHRSNVENEYDGIFMPLSYFVFAFFLAWLTLKFNSIELAVGIHISNNLMPLLAYSKKSSLPINSLFTIDRIDGFTSFAIQIVVALVFYLIVTRVIYKKPEPA